MAGEVKCDGGLLFSLAIFSELYAEFSYELSQLLIARVSHQGDIIRAGTQGHQVIFKIYRILFGLLYVTKMFKYLSACSKHVVLGDVYNYILRLCGHEYFLFVYLQQVLQSTRVRASLGPPN